VGLGELARRQVDVDGRVQGTGPLARQRAAWRQLSANTHAPRGTIRPVSSAKGTNSARQDQPPARPVPADQGLDPDQAALLERDDRLVQGAQLVGLPAPIDRMNTLDCPPTGGRALLP
jgi:hypothetical protein